MGSIIVYSCINNVSITNNQKLNRAFLATAVFTLLTIATVSTSNASNNYSQTKIDVAKINGWLNKFD